MDRFLCQLCDTIVRCGENHPCFCYDDDNEPNPNDLEANNTNSAMLEEVHSENFNNSVIIYSNFQQNIVEATSEETADNNEQISLLPKYTSLLAATSNNTWSLSSSDNSLLDSTTVIRQCTVVETRNNSTSKIFCGSENTFKSLTTLANTALPLGEKNLDEFEPRKNLDTTIAKQADTGSLGSNTNAKLCFKKSQEFRIDASAVARVPVNRPSLQTTALKRKRDSDLSPQKLKNEAGLISHDGKRAREKRFECNTCQKRFSKKDHYTNHLRTHTGEKPYKCEYCDSRFSRKDNLDIHLRTHTGEKPYGCEYCESRFSKRDHYTTHLRTHTGEKPYGCEYCESRFSHKVTLDSHRRLHTGEKPFKCEICKKDFALRSSLRRHAAEVHIQERLLKCEVCGKAFKSDRARNQHRKKMH